MGIFVMIWPRRCRVTMQLLTVINVQSVLLRSEPLPDGTPTVRGHDFETGRDLDAIMEAMLRSGFQATNMGQAINVVNDMVRLASCTQARDICPSNVTNSFLLIFDTQPHIIAARRGRDPIIYAVSVWMKRRLSSPVST